MLLVGYVGGLLTAALVWFLWAAPCVFRPEETSDDDYMDYEQ